MGIPHYNVVFATPGKEMKTEYVQSLMLTTAYLNSRGLTYTYMSKQSSFVSEAREMTATNTFGNNWKTLQIGSGEFTYDKIVWIDSDVEWTVEDFKRVWESNLDIVSGICITGPQGLVGAHYPDSQGRPTFIHKDEFMLHDLPVEVGGVGFAFVAMKSGVFENIERPWFLIRRIKWDDVDFYTNVGEDYSWCAAAQKAGYRIWIDPLIKVKHHKEVAYSA